MNHGKARCIASTVWILSLLMATIARSSGAEEIFDPYSVYVDQEEVSARCGPGGQYYRTDPLRHGQRLEVYVETADGWLGVRPPENAFCWVPADSVNVNRSGDLGQVAEAGTLAWIGTHLGKARKYMWQVQLTKGESVQILGRAEREGPDGPQMWYRIAPPAGEFRWVHRDQVVNNPEMLVRGRPQAGESIASGVPTVAEQDLAANDSAAPRDLAASGELARDGQSRAAEDNGQGLLATAKSILLQRADDPAPPETTGNRPASGLMTPDEPALLAQQPLQRFESPGAIPLTPDAIPLTPGAAPTADLSASSASFADSQSLAAQIGQTDNAGFPPLPSAEEAAELALAQRRRAAEPAPVMVDPQVRQVAATDRDPGAVQPAAGSQPAAADGQPAALPPPAAVGDSDSNWVRGSSRDRVAITASAGTAANGGPPSAPASAFASLPGDADFDTLQLELSRRMGQSATADAVEPIRQAAARLVAAAASEGEQQRARLLVQRIEQYQAVALRRDASRAGGPAADQRGDQPSGRAATTAPASAFRTAAQQSAQSLVALPASARSDAALPAAATLPAVSGAPASGYLVQVYSARPDSPPFALTDARGKTTHYLSPAPGVNLRRFLNQHVTVGGPSGYETGLDTPHVQVQSAARSLEP